jgi:hypothetical protein
LGATTITAEVSDGSLKDAATAIVTVTRTNQKPSLNSKTPASATTVSRNVSQKFAVSVSDPNGDPITYTWVVNNSVVKTGPDSTYTGIFTDPHNTAKTVMAIFADPDGLKDSISWAFTITKVESEQGIIPTEFSLGQNYPNPFNPSTMISFALPNAAPVFFEIFNTLGIKVRTLMAGEMRNAGLFTVSWDGKSDSGVNMPSGVYLYRLHAGTFGASKKMTLLK